MHKKALEALFILILIIKLCY